MQDEKGVFIRVGRERIDVGDMLARLADPASGGVSVFIGRVRDEPPPQGRHPTVLTYEAYLPLAEKELQRLTIEARDRFHVRRIAIAHRTGTLSTGNVSVVVAVAAGHRREAFAACRFLIDRLKKEVPIWKSDARTGRARAGTRRAPSSPPGRKRLMGRRLKAPSRRGPGFAHKNEAKPGSG